MVALNFLSKTLIILGSLLILIGILINLIGRIPYLGKLPGDIVIKKGNFTLYFPLVTCLLLSLLLTIIFNLFSKR